VLDVIGTTEPSLVDIVLRRAAELPDQMACEFVSDAGGETVRLSFGELGKRAARIGAVLAESTVPGEPVILLFPDSQEFVGAFLACLWARRTAVPVHCPTGKHLDGLANIIADCSAQMIMSTRAVADRLRNDLAGREVLPGLRWIHVDEISDVGPNLTLKAPQRATADDIAFLQYTSGSTRRPRGVTVRHGNLLHNLRQIAVAFQHDRTSRGVIWLPHFHDMGLVGGLLQPLYAGFPVSLMSPFDFIRDPARWLRLISETSATTSGGPNFAYEICVERVSRAVAETLDLRSWKVAFVGAELINPVILERFAKHFAVSGFDAASFFPCYGLAESTLYVSGGPVGAGVRTKAVSSAAIEVGLVRSASGDGRTVVSCGQSLGNTVLVVDPVSRRACAPDEIGEIWVAGPSVASGYWGQADEDESVFDARLADDELTAGGFLRTGDLGFVMNGELHITGRRKDLMVIRGRNVYPHDVELTVTNGITAVRTNGCAAFSVEVDNEEQLVVMVEVDPRSTGVDSSLLVEEIRDLVSREHQLAVFHVDCVRVGRLPRTTSGKLKRGTARAEFLARVNTREVGR
jgi:acyl-CoA synthetase (AMP-forming)/AMP-acid ligase II